VKEKKPIVPQVEKWAHSQGVELYEGWKVDIAREVKRRALARPDFEKLTLDFWTKMFKELLDA
jgi:hypothetical protein